MINYRLSVRAEQDLMKIWEYTVHEWSSSQAEKYIDSLLSSFDAIGKGKITGTPIDLVRKGYKKALHGRHYIFFRFAPDGVVEIIRILHDSTDFDRHL
jgi:toxin ParE1/3/4